jgi:hypothetical protein
MGIVYKSTATATDAIVSEAITTSIFYPYLLLFSPTKNFVIKISERMRLHPQAP